jgi:hypothetical protein
MYQCFDAHLKSIAACGAIILPLMVPAAQAEDFTAGYVLREFDEKQMSAFLSGMVEGLAQARYEREGNDPAAAVCIYDWYYEGGEDTILEIYGAFAEHSRSAPAAVVSALANRKCGS